MTIEGAGRFTVTGDKNGDDVTTEGGITDIAASLDGADLLDDNSRIFNASAALTIDGLTLAGGRITAEREYGGAVRADAALTIVDSTISGNSTAGDFAYGGGAFSTRALTITNSIVLGNIARNPDGDESFEYTGDFSENEGKITITGAAIIGADSAAFDVAAQVTGSGTAQNAPAFRVFEDTAFTNGVTVGVLASNGGDVQTIALRSDTRNPALDAASIAGTDARGEARGVDLIGVANGGTPDLGAFELQDQPPTFPEFTSPDFVSVAEILTFVSMLRRSTPSNPKGTV